MPSHIVVNGLGLTYKGTIGISTATIPDVCKTPSPGGPVPIPYPNIAQQSSLKGGTTTVKAKDKMIAIKGSQYGSSNGDEAGTAGGVKSSVNMKATDWITYSFDVKMDGKNACRNTDKKFHNNQNTVDLGGNIDPMAPVPGLKEIAEECNKKVNKDNDKCPDGPSGSDCTTLGTKKHKCCEDKINEWSEENPDAEPSIDTEVPFESDGAGGLQPASESGDARSLANQAYAAAKAAGQSTAGVWADTYFSNGGACFRADVIVNSDPPQGYDFKFNCDESEPEYKAGPKKGKKKPLSRFMSEKQKDNYIAATGSEPEIIHVDGRRC